EQPLYDRYNFKIYTDEQLLPNGLPIGSTTVPTFVCPSDEPRDGTDQRTGQVVTLSPDLLKTYKMSNYQASRGNTRHQDGGSGCALTDIWNTQFGTLPINAPPPNDGFTWGYPDNNVGPTPWRQLGGPFTRIDDQLKF